MDWRLIGAKLFEMTLGQISWGSGGLPWFCNNNFTNSIMPNLNWGQVGDSYSPSKAPVKDDPKKVEEEKNEEKKLTPAERKAKEKELAEKKTGIEKTINNYNNLLKTLEKYAESLDGEAKTNLENFLAKYSENTKIDKSKSEKDKYLDNLLKNIGKKGNEYEKLIEDYNVLLEEYKELKPELEAAKLNDAKKELTATSNENYKTLASNLNTQLTNNNDELFGGILEKTDSGSYKLGQVKIDGENVDIDIMELISTWNSEESTKGSHLMKAIAEKYSTAENKGNYETLVNKLHDKLSNAADNLLGKLDKDSETKTLLKNAQNQFDKFNSIDKRFPSDESIKGENYSNAFDNLYRAIRLAEAEIVAKNLEKEFNFLGDQNPYKTTTFVADTKADLKQEGLENELETKLPMETKIPEAAQEIKVGTTSYHILTKDGKTEFYSANGAKIADTEFKNTVGEVNFKADGSYSITKGDKIEYFKADHTPLSEEVFNKIPNPKITATDQEIIDFFNIEKSGKNDETKQAWLDYGHKLANNLIGYTNEDDANSAANIIFNGITPKNVFTALAGYEDNDGMSYHNIIEQLYWESDFSGKYTNSEGKECSANEKDCIKQIIDMAIINLTAQKGNPKIKDKSQLDTDITKLQGYSASVGTFTEENSEAVDEILQRYSDMVNDNIDYDAAWVEDYFKSLAQSQQMKYGNY